MSSTPRADLCFATVLTAFGVAVVAQSWRMPRLQELGVHPMSAPGLTPGVLGLVIAGLGLALLIRSLRAGAAGAGTSMGTDAPAADRIGRTRLVVTLALCLAFGAVLLGRLPFWLATGLYVFAFVAVFRWRDGQPLRRLVGAAALAAGVAFSVSLLFERVFLIRLP